MEVGSVLVTTTTNKGHDPEFWAQTIADRVVSVGGNCHPVIAQQAAEFKDAVKATALHYIKEAIKSDRTTLTAEFELMTTTEIYTLSLHDALPIYPWANSKCGLYGRATLFLQTTVNH